MQQQPRRAPGVRWIESILSDLRFGLRHFRRKPVAAATMVVVMALGIGFSLFDMPALSLLASRVVAEEQARRRPVTVTITADVAAAARVEMTPTTEPDERPMEMPIRLALAPSGA